MFLKRAFLMAVMALSLGLGKARAQAVADSTVKSKPKKPKSERLVVVSPSNVKMNIKIKKLLVNPVVGFSPVVDIKHLSWDSLELRALYGIRISRSYGRLSTEAGFFDHFGIRMQNKADFYRQAYVRGAFNLARARGDTVNRKDSLRSISAELGYFKRVNRDVDETGFYFATGYEQTLKWLHPFGKKHGLSTIAGACYVQYKDGPLIDPQTSLGLRLGVLSPFKKVFFKALNVDLRVGPYANYDTREGFSGGVDFVQNFSKFRKTPAKLRHK